MQVYYEACQHKSCVQRDNNDTRHGPGHICKLHWSDTFGRRKSGTKSDNNERATLFAHSRDCRLEHVSRWIRLFGLSFIIVPVFANKLLHTLYNMRLIYSPTLLGAGLVREMRVSFKHVRKKKKEHSVPRRYTSKSHVHCTRMKSMLTLKCI